MQPDKNTDHLVYHLTLFKLEGHTTWRAHLAQKKDSFDHEWKTNIPKDGKKPAITDKQVLIIDRVSGMFKVNMKEI